MVNRTPIEKSLTNNCPKKFCFFWRDAGNFFVSGLYNDIDEAMKHTKPILESGCGCTFGTCIRNENEKGKKDWYETCEPELENRGLPWFYFCDPQKLKIKDRKMYDEYFRNSSVADWRCCGEDI